MKINSLVVVLALVVGASAGAADRTAAKARQLAMLVLPEANWNKIQDGTTQAVVMQATQEAAKKGEQLPADFSQRLGVAMKQLISYSEIIDMQTGLLVKYYNARELDQLLRFYASPVGKKTIQVMPELQRDVQGLVMTKLATQMPKILQQLQSDSAPAAAQ